ncbi:hypothetical protein G9A89_012138 [Geosiphon pyriformis]|nr:hypothetical protein G9A89_012138 [Geosiphon pyriformis]
MVRKSLKSKAGLFHDFPDAALHHLSLYGLKTFEQVQSKGKIAALVTFFNASGVLGCLFNYRFLDLQILGWALLDSLQFPVKLRVSPVNNFLAGIVKIFLSNELSLANNLPNAFCSSGHFLLSLILSSSEYFNSVHSLKCFEVAFGDRILDKRDHVLNWKTFYYWKRLNPQGPMPYWFSVTSEFMLVQGFSASSSAGFAQFVDTNILDSEVFSLVKDGLHNIWSSCFEVYTDRSLRNAGLVDAACGAAAYFLVLDRSVGVVIGGLLFSTLTELQAVVLALECVPFSCQVILHTDSQAAINVCLSELSCTMPDFHNQCWLKRRHIFNLVRKKDLEVVWVKVKSHSGVSVHEHYLVAENTAISGNACHFAEPGVGVISVDLVGCVDWISTMKVWHLNFYMLAKFTGQKTLNLCLYLMKAVHRCLLIAVQKKLYNKGYPGVLCLLCGEVEFSDHVFTCLWDVVIHNKVLVKASAPVLQTLFACSLNIGLYFIMCKGFMLNKWCEEAWGVFENKKQAIGKVVSFVRFVADLHYVKAWLVRSEHRVRMEKAGLVADGKIVSGLFRDVSSILSGRMVRMLGVVDSFTVSFGCHLPCCFFSGLGGVVSVNIAKSKKAAPDICSEISNKISTRGAFSVVEATKQNVLEAFLLLSNHNKLPLVVTEATSSSLAGFSSVKVLLKRHIWVSSSIASTPTKSPKVFNNRPVNKLVFLSIAFTSDAANTSSSKKMKSKQLLVSAIVTPNLFVVSNKILNEIFIISFGTLSKIGLDQPLAVLSNVVFSSKSLLVLEAKQFLPVGSSVFGNWTDQIETESSPFLVSSAISDNAWRTITSHQRFAGWVASTLVLVLKDNVKLFYMEFASQVFLKAVFLVEFTSSVHLATLKIAKSLVVSESGSLSVAVALHDVPLSVFAADIKTALNVFGSITCVVLKPVGIWQYVVVYFKKLDSTVSVLNYWSVLVGKNSVRILLLVNQNETILSHDKFKAKLSGHYFQFALVIFGSQADLDSAIVKTDTLRKCHIWWETSSCWHCFKCQELGYLTADCKVFLPSPPKFPKVFTPCFAGPKSYVKASALLDSSGFLLLSPLVFSPVVVGNSLLSVLVKSIVKPIGFLVTIFEQFINDDLVSSSALGLKINKVMVHMGFFSRTVSKLGREVVSLKKEYCMENIDMSGNSELPPVVSNKVFSNLMSLWEHKSVDVKNDLFKTAKWLVGLVSCSVTLFSVIQKMLSLGKFFFIASI